MSESSPVGGANTQVVIEFEYELSDDSINDVIDQVGVRPPKRWRIAFNLANDVATPEARRELRQASEIYQAAPGIPTLPRVVKGADEFLQLIQPWLEARRGPALEAKAEASRFDREKEEWVAQYGSDRLRLALQRGYKINRTYALERAAHDIPGAWIDTADTADLRERTDPSMRALEFEEQVNDFFQRRGIDAEGVIMWVAEGPRSDDQLLLVDEEAVVVRNYLGRYTAIIPVDPDYRAPAAAVS